MIDTNSLTIKEAQEGLGAGLYSTQDLWATYSAEAKEKNSDVFAYLELFERENSPKEGALKGMPLALKDNILFEGHRASASSKILEGYVAPYSATAVTKCLDAGAVFLGRTNMDEFAMGSSTENSAFGATKNPHDLARIPGGSSGGSAAAVAMGGAIAALGSDTGGSIRQPASHCGLIGLKPTYGAVSRYGLIAMGSSLDQIGPIAKNVEDTELLFNIIKGVDPFDSTSREQEKFAPKKNLTIGVPYSFFENAADEDVVALFKEKMKALEDAGHTIKSIELPVLSDALAAYYIIMPAEASTNLARFDGIRYGLSKEGKDVREAYENTRKEGFGSEVKRRILIGTYVLSAGYHDEFYGAATRYRASLTNELTKVFADIDIVATPTVPSPAYTFGEKQDPLSVYLEDIFTVPANLSGIPALSVPMGTVTRTQSQLPVGIQFMAGHDNEAVLFSAGFAVENSF